MIPLTKVVAEIYQHCSMKINVLQLAWSLCVLGAQGLTPKHLGADSSRPCQPGLSHQ